MLCDAWILGYGASFLVFLFFKELDKQKININTILFEIKEKIEIKNAWDVL